MKTNFKMYFFAAITMIGFGIASVRAQEQLPAPSPIEKEIAARASDVTEVTLDKNMLNFAAQFMNNNDSDQENVKKLIDGLDGIYVRTYEFDKDGAYTADELDQLRKYFTNTGEWQALVKERSHKDGESTDVLMKMAGGQTKGMFVLTAEPKELTIVFILGPIQMDQLKNLNGLGAHLGSLPNPAALADANAQSKANTEQPKAAEKARKQAERERKDAEKHRQAVEKGTPQEEK